MGPSGVRGLVATLQFFVLHYCYDLLVQLALSARGSQVIQLSNLESSKEKRRLQFISDAGG